MDDLISRQAAIDALAKFVPHAICDESSESYTNGLTDAYNLICQLPSAQQWIPCSERLPEEKGRYLITTKRFGDFVVDWNIFMIGTKIIQEGWLYSGDVIAWMPMPEPYKGEE